MTIVLLRHGKTEANEKKLYCGKTDIPLSSAGVRELIQLQSKIYYPELPAAKYYHSGLTRAVGTMAILYPNQIGEELSSLREYDFGDFEMHSYDELKESHDYQAWITGDDGFCPNGEGKLEFRERILRGFDELIQKGQNAIVITHGGVIANIMGELFNSKKGFYEWQPDFGYGYEVIFENRKAVSYHALGPIN